MPDANCSTAAPPVSAVNPCSVRRSVSFMPSVRMILHPPHATPNPAVTPIERITHSGCRRDAERAAEESHNRQAELRAEQCARGTGREEIVGRERPAVEPRPVKQIRFAIVGRFGRMMHSACIPAPRNKRR
jgi:hypothetical protein